ncbi:methyltransferase domain-containing protein [Drepanopeziza brunnea f. sp. 'multigermtubi' MB_m1]|uniref:Methyltransferase domain-containing protein n=1 Tax=Marssonina brunnea f. sp. multigermtubi (strain MB_m1) TaxID=1072389 RepID=K1X401_MARBU|nr:methyltransferase domain-containing protein [Drepanopeziza brunnea f. sp. 'multigermtubi' MB_m1]EKD15433.1 methyltransferase domain-containing protein [Drepanopeziza brunnea f. sp. 'multigermtubi' MB_m1]
MATFTQSTFNALSYATFRPSYPRQLFQKVLAFHNASPNATKGTLLDLGCGHGLISRELSPSFTTVLGTDPSASMISQAQSSTPQEKYTNISYRQASAEDLSFVADGSLDMVVAGQAAHWFDFGRAWPELSRTVRKGGTLAFWGYKDNYLVDFPKATRVLDEYCYGEDHMGPYWEQPGRSILRDLYRGIVPPESGWEDVERIEYEPSMEGKGKGKGKGEVLMQKRLTLGELEGYVRTFSAFVNYREVRVREGKREKRRNTVIGRGGDVVDRMFDEMRRVESSWEEMGKRWRYLEVENEWGSIILLARRR